MRRLGWACCLALVMTWSGSAFAGEGEEDPPPAECPPNVGDAAHCWLWQNLDAAMPYLIQTQYGPLPSEHIHVVEGLGEWCARRGKSKHQGTDFVLDVPYETKYEELLVGALIDGKIVHLEAGWGAYGNTVFVYRDSAPKMLFLYAHLRRIDVEPGASVRVGDALGAFGCTGNCRKLRGEYVQNQVHVEVYHLPDDFVPEQINWESMPMRQLRKLATRSHKRAHGIDITRYFRDYSIERLGLTELKKRYKAHCKEDRLESLLRELSGASPDENVSEISGD